MTLDVGHLSLGSLPCAIEDADAEADADDECPSDPSDPDERYGDLHKFDVAPEDVGAAKSPWEVPIPSLFLDPNPDPERHRRSAIPDEGNAIDWQFEEERLARFWNGRRGGGGGGGGDDGHETFRSEIGFDWERLDDPLAARTDVVKPGSGRDIGTDPELNAKIKKKKKRQEKKSIRCVGPTR